MITKKILGTNCTYLITEHFDLADSSMHWFSTGIKILVGVHQKVQWNTSHSLLCREVRTQTVDTEHQLWRERNKQTNLYPQRHYARYLPVDRIMNSEKTVIINQLLQHINMYYM